MPVAGAGIGVYVVVALVGTAVFWGAVCTYSDCPYDLSDTAESIVGGGWEATKWVVGASVDAGKAIGEATVDAGQALGGYAESAVDGVAGWFTKSNGEKLREALTGEGEEALTGEEAHHIVPVNAGDDEMREILEEVGIGINDAANGVFLPGPDSPDDNTKFPHRSAHTNRYFDELLNSLRRVRGNETGVRSVLDSFRDALRSGRNYPGASVR